MNRSCRSSLIALCKSVTGIAVVGLMLLSAAMSHAAEPAATPVATSPSGKIVLIAGKKSHGPGAHEYERGCKLLKHCLDTAANVHGVRSEVYLDGWPTDPHALDDARTILMYCDGSDHNEADHPLLRKERLEQMDRLMKRGVGFVAIHYTVFVPQKVAGERFLDWLGGYFDYETGNTPNHWFSKIAVHTLEVKPGTPEHPICRGLKPFELQEEYYYNIRMRPDDARRKPILIAPIPGEPEQTVAWAVERADGGRGFGFTGGHFHSNWGVENFRKMVLNALLWTAKIDVPAEGVISQVAPADLQIGAAPPPAPAVTPIRPTVRAAIFTGYQHPAHDWRATTEAMRKLLTQDGSFEVTVLDDPSKLTHDALAHQEVLILNYMNWQKPGLEAAQKQALLDYVGGGGGLAVVHFANSAFGDWPQYRELARRVWVAGKSAHDAYGPFQVEITGADHPITRGMHNYATTDELYFHQFGDAPIQPLAVARSKATGQLEPMAFAYGYQRGKVFQTVLGHDVAALTSTGTTELLRRGCAWAAGRELAPSTQPGDAPAKAQQLTAEGRFGQALNSAAGSVGAAPQAEYQEPPLTVECWGRLRSKGSFNVMIANGPKESSTHWELYSYAGSGAFSVYLPGYTPAEIASKVDVCDDRWHAFAMVFAAGKVKLYVDGKQVHEAEVKATGAPKKPGRLTFGHYPGIGCDGLVDEVRISCAERTIDGLPSQPFAADDKTVGLWHFDTLEAGAFADASRLHNKATTGTSGVQSSYRPADPRIKSVLVDQSPTESFLSMRGDGAGRLFVGGREALFVYEPDAKGGYRPRQELYRFPPHTWLTDLELRGDDVYVMTASAIYVLPGARLKREGIVPRRLIWGWPVDLHVTLHGMAWGPEGDLYFAAGDPLLNYGDFSRADHWGHWTVYSQPDGTKTPYTGAGGVFRVRPDGSQFRVVARGTRGSDGLAFDNEWNLFTNDNDHESLAAQYSPARLLHVTPYADFSWPRGWMPDITPQRADLLDIMFTGMGRGVPVAEVFYGEPLLPGLNGTLLVPRWDAHAVEGYRLEQRGATIGASEFPLLLGEGNARPVGAAVVRGGRVLAAVSYMAQNEGSPTYPSDLVLLTPHDDPSEMPFEVQEPTAQTIDALYAALNSPSHMSRSAAHQEILRRGTEALAQAPGRLKTCDVQSVAMNHLIWLAAACGGGDAVTQLGRLVSSPVANVRWQTLRALAEFKTLATSRDTFVRALDDSDARIRLTAIAALIERDGDVPAALVQGPARSRDRYLRQTAATYLARRAKPEMLVALCGDSDPQLRLAGILAAGTRLTVPLPEDPVPEGVKLQYFNPNALFTIDYAGERVDLRALAPVGSYTIAERWAAHRSLEQEQIARLLGERLGDADDQVRFQAAYYLSLLGDAKLEPQVAKAQQASARKQLAAAHATPIDKAWLLGPADASLQLDARAWPIDLAAPLTAADGLHRWTRLGEQKQPSARAGAGVDTVTLVYFRLQSGAMQGALLDLAGVADAQLWHNGQPVLVKEPTVLVTLEPGTNDFLLRLPGALPNTPLSVRTVHDVAIELPLPAEGGSLADRLKSGNKDQLVAAEFLTVDWNAARGEGNIEHGRKLFGVTGIGCVKCHAMTPDQTGGGAPSLVGAGKRFTPPHIVESVLTPSKQIADAFRATTIITRQGQAETGLIVRETSSEIELLLPNATRKALAKADIEQRQLSPLSAMPAGLVKTPQELRDLLTYILSDNPPAP